jgi:hypothetical protein
MPVKSKYIVISDKEDLSLEWGKRLQSSMGICHTFRRAYDIAIFLSGITSPGIQYRKALETIKLEGAVTISQETKPSSVIVLVKIY